MKLILKEYISALKEEKELEGLMVSLLREMKIRVLTIPQKGRQHGVDLLARGVDKEDGKEKLFLFALKQGDIDRSEWNTKQNSVKQTVDEIRDTFITTKLTPAQKRLPKKVIVGNNGYINQNVQSDWTAYVQKYSESDGIEIESWNVETLLFLVEEHLIDQSIFPKEDQVLLSKTLALIDTNTHDFRHLQELLDSILNSKEKRTKKNLIKRIRTVNLIQALMLHWSEEDDNLKPAVIASEKVVLNVWHWILENNYNTDGKLMLEFDHVLKQKAKVDILYINKIIKHIETPHALSRYTAINHVEYALITWECIGFVSCAAALQLNWFSVYQDDPEISASFEKNFNYMAEHLISLIYNNPSSKYIYLDEHVIEYSLASFVLLFADREFLRSWSEEILKTMIDNYRIKKSFPQFYTDHETLLRSQIAPKDDFAKSSIFLTTLADILTVLEDDKGYSLLQKACDKNGIFKDIYLQSWYPDEDSEKEFFKSNILRSTGITVTTQGLPVTMDKYVKEIEMEERTLSVEYKETGLASLWFFACRNYRNIVPPHILRSFIGLKVEAN